MHTYTASSEFNPVINTKPFGVKETSPGRLLTGVEQAIYIYLNIYIHPNLIPKEYSPGQLLTGAEQAPLFEYLHRSIYLSIYTVINIRV